MEHYMFIDDEKFTEKGLVLNEKCKYPQLDFLYTKEILAEEKKDRLF